MNRARSAALLAVAVFGLICGCFSFSQRPLFGRRGYEEIPEYQEGELPPEFGLPLEGGTAPHSPPLVPQKNVPELTPPPQKLEPAPAATPKAYSPTGRRDGNQRSDVNAAALKSR